jgi:hypothetical protein
MNQIDPGQCTENNEAGRDEDAVAAGDDRDR